MLPKGPIRLLRVLLNRSVTAPSQNDLRMWKFVPQNESLEIQSAAMHDASRCVAAVLSSCQWIGWMDMVERWMDGWINGWALYCCFLDLTELAMQMLAFACWCVVV